MEAKLFVGMSNCNSQLMFSGKEFVGNWSNSNLVKWSCNDLNFIMDYLLTFS